MGTTCLLDPVALLHVLLNSSHLFQLFIRQFVANLLYKSFKLFDFLLLNLALRENWVKRVSHFVWDSGSSDIHVLFLSLEVIVKNFGRDVDQLDSVSSVLAESHDFTFFNLEEFELWQVFLFDVLKHLAVLKHFLDLWLLIIYVQQWSIFVWKHKHDVAEVILGHLHYFV